jgi:hypothetical protein
MGLGGLFVTIFTGGRYGGGRSLGPNWGGEPNYAAEKATRPLRWNPHDDPYYQAQAQATYERHLAEQQAAEIRWGLRS